MKLFDTTQKIIGKTSNGAYVPGLEAVEVFLLQCSLADNQYQQNSEVLYAFIPNKCYGYLLNVEPSNLVLLKTYNTKVDDITIIYSLRIYRSKCYTVRNR